MESGAPDLATRPRGVLTTHLDAAGLEQLERNLEAELFEQTSRLLR
jgi:hypothetical protein